jgi:predicted O-methyltransferase YrrM
VREAETPERGGPAPPPSSGAALELRDRVLGYADLLLDRVLGRRPVYETAGWDETLRDLEAYLGPFGAVLEEPPLREVEEDTRRFFADTTRADAYRPRWAVDSLLARCCYVVCRLLEPDVVVETGVAYGVSSAFVLKALEANGRGALHSIELPPLRPLRQGSSWGAAVPAALRHRWTVHRGASARVLPGLLREIGAPDVFLHDSLHTERNMRREFEYVWPRLRTGGVVLADDVELNGAFGGLRRGRPEFWRVVRDRESRPLSGGAAPVVFGVAIK